MDARGSLLSSTAEEPQGPVDYQFYHGPMHTRKFAHKLASGMWLDYDRFECDRTDV